MGNTLICINQKQKQIPKEEIKLGSEWLKLIATGESPEEPRKHMHGFKQPES